MMITEFLGTCSDKKIARLSEIKGKKFSYETAKKLIKEFDAEMYENLALDFPNPWYYETNIKEEFQILHIVHSAIDYLFKYEIH